MNDVNELFRHFINNCKTDGEEPDDQFFFDYNPETLSEAFCWLVNRIFADNGPEASAVRAQIVKYIEPAAIDEMHKMVSQYHQLLEQ